MGHGGLKELALCPEILLFKKQFVSSSAAETVIRKFDMPLGVLEAFDLLAVSYDVETIPGASNSEHYSVCLSVLPLENAVITLVALDTIHLREDTFALVHSFDQSASAVGQYVFTRHYFITLPRPHCLVRPITLFVNHHTASGTLRVTATVMMVKKSLPGSVITQLLKIYQDVKSVFKQG